MYIFYAEIYDSDTEQILLINLQQHAAHKNVFKTNMYSPYQSEFYKDNICELLIKKKI